MTGLAMDRQSIIELQKIDCNCNECIFMQRDFETYKKWELFHMDSQKREFDRKKKAALKVANECKDEKGKQTLLNIANKMTFMFDKSVLMQYGNCIKLNKPVSFLVGTCQIETQHCFQHRRG